MTFECPACGDGDDMAASVVKSTDGSTEHTIGVCDCGMLFLLRNGEWQTFVSERAMHAWERVAAQCLKRALIAESAFRIALEDLQAAMAGEDVNDVADERTVDRELDELFNKELGE